MKPAMRPNPLDSPLDVLGLVVRELTITLWEQLEPLTKVTRFLERAFERR